MRVLCIFGMYKLGVGRTGKFGKILHLQMARRYVVFVGKVLGIYERWSDCHAQIHGYGGACYNRFDSLAEAKEAFANYNAAQQPHGNLPPPAPLQPQPVPLHEQTALFHQQPTAPPAPPVTLHPHPAAPHATLNPQPVVPNAQGLCGLYAIHEGNHSPFERYFWFSAVIFLIAFVVRELCK